MLMINYKNGLMPELICAFAFRKYYHEFIRREPMRG